MREQSWRYNHSISRPVDQVVTNETIERIQVSDEGIAMGDGGGERPQRINVCAGFDVGARHVLRSVRSAQPVTKTKPERQRAIGNM